MVLDPPLTPEQALIAKQDLPWLESYIDRLRPREGMAIRIRYGIRGEQEHTLRQAGERLGVTTERFRQIEGKALRKLKRWLTPEVHPEHIAKARKETAERYHAQRAAWLKQEQERVERWRSLPVEKPRTQQPAYDRGHTYGFGVFGFWL